MTEPLQQVIQTTLEAYNYRTLSASDGFEAISLYVEYRSRISVVLMDIMMPAMDGLTAIHTLQELNPEVKVIATSRLAANSQVAEDTGSSVKAIFTQALHGKTTIRYSAKSFK